MKKEKIKEICKTIISILVFLMVGSGFYWLICKASDYTVAKMRLEEQRQERFIENRRNRCKDAIVEKSIVGIFLNSSLSGEGSMGGYGFGLLFFGWGKIDGDFSIDANMNYYFYLKEDDGGLKLSQVSTQNSRIFERDIEVNEAKIKYITEATFSGTNCSRSTRYEFIIPRGTIVPFYNLIP